MEKIQVLHHTKQNPKTIIRYFTIKVT